MKLEYNISGLDCAHCAMAMEKSIDKIKGVDSCVINFSTSKMFLEIEKENHKAIIEKVFKTAKKIEPSVVLSQDPTIKNGIKLIDIILYLIGLVLGLIVVFVPMGKVLYYILLGLSALLMGYKTYWLAIRQLCYFKINENTLITLSIICASIIGESAEALMVIALYTFGKMLEAKAVNYSRKSISALISTQPDYAVLINDGEEDKVKPELCEIGNKIIVRVGEKVPLDGKIIDGFSSVDKKHLTGESEPINVGVGDFIESGSIVLTSTLIIEVTALYKDSAICKILDLVSNATNRKSKTETVVSKFASVYTIVVILLSFLVWGINWVVLKDINIAVYRGLIFLVISCPCAFAISIPLSYFSGIGRCSKNGILIKGSSFLDVFSRVDKIIFDKTGTLTTGNFSVSKVVVEKGINKNNLLDIVVAGEKNSLHPIAKAIVKYHKSKSNIKINEYKEISGKGIQFKVGKEFYFIGKVEDDSGHTIVDIRKNNLSVGKIYLKDEVKTNAKELIKNLKKLKIKTLMLTGDNDAVAKNVAKEIKIDEFVANLLPEDKYKIINDEKSKNQVVSFVGDGINDAPALTLSDVGISMGISGSQATIESSDVVIADDNLCKIYDLFNVSKQTKKIVWENIIFAIVIKVLFLALGAFGIVGMLLAVFADVGVTLLAIFNSLRILTYKKRA